MSLEIKGKLIQKLPVQSGTGKTGNSWQKQEIIVETMEQYPKKICVAVWGDKIDEVEKFAISDTLNISIFIESREFNGRWYTDVRAWRMMKEEPAKPAGLPHQNDNLMESATFTDDINVNDDLPF